MGARLVIHAEIDTPEDLFEACAMFLQKNADNPFALQRFGQYCVGIAKGISEAQIEQPGTEVPLEEGVKS